MKTFTNYIIFLRCVQKINEQEKTSIFLIFYTKSYNYVSNYIKLFVLYIIACKYVHA